MSYGEVVLVQEWQVWRVVSRWVTIEDRLSQFGVWCCEAWIGEAGGVRRCQVRSVIGMLRLERSFVWMIK